MSQEEAVSLVLGHRRLVTHSVNLGDHAGWGMKERGSGVAHVFLSGSWNHSLRGVHLGWVRGRDNEIGFGHGTVEVPEGEAKQKRRVSHPPLCKYGFSFAADSKD